jgi:hypothetical protein
VVSDGPEIGHEAEPACVFMLCQIWAAAGSRTRPPALTVGVDGGWLEEEKAGRKGPADVERLRGGVASSTVWV